MAYACNLSLLFNVLCNLFIKQILILFGFELIVWHSSHCIYKRYIVIDPSFEHNNNRFVPQERLKIEVSMGTTSSSIFVVKRKPRVFSHFFLWFTGMKSIRIIGSFIGSNEFLCILLLTKV